MRNDFLRTIVERLDEADRLEIDAKVQAIDDSRDGNSRVSERAKIMYERANAIRSDTSAHLVFADWLEENGEEEQAELIRVECDIFRQRNGEFKASPENDRLQDALEKRAIELRKEVNRFSDSIKVTWDRGLVAGMRIGTASWRFIIDEDQLGEADSPFKTHPIRTIRLPDWHGVDHSLPKNPAEALPWLRRLELPRSVRGEEWHGLVTVRDSVIHDAFVYTTIQSIEKLFDGRVKVVFWDDGQNLFSRSNDPERFLAMVRRSGLPAVSTLMPDREQLTDAQLTAIYTTTTEPDR